MTYILACLHCGSAVARTPRVGDAEVRAVEMHLRAEHPDRIRPGHLDFAELLGHVRVKMAD